MTFGLDEFKRSALGREVATILNSKENVIKMIALSEHGIPAVQAIGKRVERIGKPVSDGEKKLIGRWVREVLEQEGWTTDMRKGRVSPGNLFTTGAIYHPRELEPNATTIAAMQEARGGGLPEFKDVASLLSDLNAND